MMTNKKARSHDATGLEKQFTLAFADLVERTAIREMLFLRFRPPAKLLVNGEEFQLRKCIFIFLRHFRVAWAIEVFAAISCPSGE